MEEDHQLLAVEVVVLIDCIGLAEHTGQAEPEGAVVVHKVPAVADVALHTDLARLAAALVVHRASWKPGYTALAHIDSMEQLKKWKVVAGRGTRLDV